LPSFSELRLVPSCASSNLGTRRSRDRATAGSQRRYFEDCNEAEVVDGEDLSRNASGVAAYALDPDDARRLWELSLEAFGWA
jgi:hypothetical protein